MRPMPDHALVPAAWRVGWPPNCMWCFLFSSEVWKHLNSCGVKYETQKYQEQDETPLNPRVSSERLFE